MSTDFHGPATVSQIQPMQPMQLDTGPLSWVMSEIRVALGQSLQALQYSLAVSDDLSATDVVETPVVGGVVPPYDQTTALQYAKTYLHQAHGALQMVDIDGVTVITDAVENLLEYAQTEQCIGRTALTVENVQSIQSAYQALIEYLEELLAGAMHQPVKLFPYYKALLEIRGADRIHPADLFFPDLTTRPQFDMIESSTSFGASPLLGQLSDQVIDQSVDYSPLRKRFEMALLPFLKSADSTVECTNAAIMQAVIADISLVQKNHQVRAFWWVLQGFADGVANAQIANELFVKQLFARINLQLRRLSQGSSSISERLLRDALFFISRIDAPSALNAQIRSTYRLDGLVPSDFSLHRYGQVDLAALRAAKEHLTRAKQMWDCLAAGEPDLHQEFEQEMLGLSAVGSKLNAPSLAKLLRELSGIARHATLARQGDPIGLEIATSLLFIEYSLSCINRLPVNFSESADAMTAHLLSVMSDEPPAEPMPWLDDIYRDAQQKKIVKVLVGEMLVSLRHVEKLLDEYFVMQTKREVLTQIDYVLHQIEGALAIQEKSEAAAVVAHTRVALQQLFDAGEDVAEPAQEEFERIAQNIGALSFYLEAVQHQADKSDFTDAFGSQTIRLSFDPQRSVFRVNLLERHTAVHLLQSGAMPHSVASISTITISPIETSFEKLEQTDVFTEKSGDSSQSISSSFLEALPSLSFLDVPTVEVELLQHQTQSVELARSLAANPENAALHGQLKDALVQLRVDAALSDDHAAVERAQAAIKILNDQYFSASQQSLTEIIAVIVPHHNVENFPEMDLDAPSQISEEEADAELLDIFLSEAEEVLDIVQQTVPLARSAPDAQEHLIVLRRAFHTLKGSSRMIGMNAFGDASWAVEQVLNLWLTEARSGTPDLYALLDHAVVFLDDWVKEVYADGGSTRTSQILIEYAEQVRDGKTFLLVESATTPIKPSSAAFRDIDLSLSSNIENIALIGNAEALLFSFNRDNSALENDEAAYQPSQIGSIDQSKFSHASLSNIHADFFDPGAEIFSFPGLPETRQDDSIKKIGDLSISLPLYNIYLSETDQLVRLLSHDFSEWRHEPERPVAVQSIYAAHSLAGSSATVGFKPLHNVAHALEMVLQRMALQPSPVREQEFDIIESTITRAKWMLQQFAQSEMPYYEPALVSALEALRHGPQVQIDDLADETVIQSDVYPEHQRINPSENAASVRPHQQSLTINRRPLISASLQAINATGLDVDPSSILRDEIDVDLLPVFLEEGRDILPQIESALRSWQSTAMYGDDGNSDRNSGIHSHALTAIPVETVHAILRHLHTIKGSARMAGAMVLGQHMHEMESHIEATLYSPTPSPHVIEELLAHYDHGVQMFEGLQRPSPISSAQQALQQALQQATPQAISGSALEDAKVFNPRNMVSTSVGATNLMSANAVHGSAPAPWLATVPGVAAVTQVRVNADVLDRLVNQAGEVSIARSRMESGVGSLQQSLVELTENVDRLRGQLREIEMQAETQISSRMTLAGEREFDPLEFDRFTRLQELTRIMAESVNDVSSLQKSLTKTVESTSADLVMQGRLTRDLQQDLMHVRMVQFASVAERLYRLTRQVSKEIDKRVNLDIRGSTVEIDRSVLEKMVGPFEHLLRNAIVHGIESREGRRAAGKNDVGQLKIEIRQNGNEILIQLSDDGQGLQLGHIRDKAEALGLLDSGQQLSDGELNDFIFRSGFSTVTEVTKLAGRGIGMDVVRSEAAALGGRVAVSSEAGKGTHFTIHLPLTLAVTQVVIFSTGSNTYAVPSALVEQVQHLKATALASAYNDGTVLWQDQYVPLHYLSALLGEHQVTPITQQYSPIILLRSGNDRVAIHVDAIIGNREVVVKNIGPQLSRMIGIVGATVLGSGDIVLILNPVPVALRLAQQLRSPLKVKSNESNMAEISQYVNEELVNPGQVIGAVASIVAPNQPAVPVQGLRTQKIVMVVDDSLTVRRVTQRLLSREGYQVVLAKDGIDALQQLQAVRPDVMLVDIEMPHMDGFDLTRNIRNDDRTRHIPIIMITSRTAAKHRTYAMELGVNEYLGKPFQEDALLAAISAFVKKEIAIM
ncbi:Hpt domain-containing protein [Glaciimonas sp. Gout2]|uniref:hybrid sensor histidine kinase/response regulator n=1 Tax=unclassified Glaciimonas TaxID=2644401 RepID=UPI002B229A61|nr:MULTISPECIES: Hpt domain-containing protein [unclassified Glaciimonas]MEB0013404.1 Hpt domain-containing protein [Glaciimonas sp. Cout2]MEB0082685.1 Hpt domain-containing protein [Glaciimonas sp. Gout2]